MARPIAEESLVLDLGIFVRESRGYPAYMGFGYLPWGRSTAGPFRWLLVTGESLDLYWQDGSGRTDFFRLSVSPAPLGGRRQWFICPRCTRRAGKLFRPLGYQYFGCRTCLDMAYESQWRESDGGGTLERFEAGLAKDRTRYDTAGPDPKKGESEIERLAVMLEKLSPPTKGEPPQPTPPELLPALPPSTNTTTQPSADAGSSTPGPVRRPRGRPREKRPYHRRAPLPESTRTGDQQGYCVKCRDFREMKDAQTVAFPQGFLALRGTCPTCQSTMMLILKRA